MPEVDAAQLEGEAMLSDRIADLVEYLVVQIVDDPDSVSLEVIDGDDTSTIEVSVAAVPSRPFARSPVHWPLASTLLSR